MVSASEPSIAAGRLPHVAGDVDRAVIWFARHWPLGVTVIAGLVLALPVSAPALQAAGQHNLAALIYLVFSFLCHQRPDRSFNLFGHQMACCERDLAIYATAFASFCAAWTVPRLRTVSPLPVVVALIASAPMAVDGTTQLVGLRESNWQLRVATGALFTLGWVWFSIPRLEKGFREVIATTERRQQLTRFV
jgi:uncharacterized membrane protein